MQAHANNLYSLSGNRFLSRMAYALKNSRPQETATKPALLRPILLLLFTCSLLPASHAGQYVIGVEQLDYYPIYEGKGHEYRGFARELLDMFAAEHGHTFIYKPMPVKRLFDRFIKGELDFKYPDNPNWSASDKAAVSILYSDTTLKAYDGLMTRTSGATTSTEQLTRISTIRGFTPWAYFDAINSGTLKVQEVNSLDAALNVVKAGRAQGAYANIAVAQDRLRKAGNNDFVFNRNLPYVESDFKLSTQRHTDVIAAFNQFMKANQVAIEALKDKYQVNVSD